MTMLVSWFIQPVVGLLVRTIRRLVVPSGFDPAMRVVVPPYPTCLHDRGGSGWIREEWG